MKNWSNEQDLQDFEQEIEIKRWLECEGRTDKIDLKYISCKGTARNTLLRGAFSLDQKIGEDSSGTFADIIVGSDGRDLFGGDRDIDFRREAEQKIRWYLSALKFNEGEIKWLLTILLSSTAKNKPHLEKYLNDSEW